MKKETFNHIINMDEPNSIFKMNIEELVEEKKIMENELKTERIVIRVESIKNNSNNNNKNIESNIVI